MILERPAKWIMAGWLLIALMPSAAWGATAEASVHPENVVSPAAFTLDAGVVDGMTYYEPVTVFLGTSGQFEILIISLDGEWIRERHLVNTIGTHTLRWFARTPEGSRQAVITFTIASPPGWWLSPVFRFYRPSLGTHFYTNSHAERDSVVSHLGDTFVYEGVGYWRDYAYDSEPLYRFLHQPTGAHFYTASDTEMESVRANLGHVYTYEGPAYGVTSTPFDGATTVWRFHNLRNGTHFYTANETEKNDVLARLGHTYALDGPAFWLGP